MGDSPTWSRTPETVRGRRLRAMPELRILDVTDAASFALVPPCADPGFDHRSCDYWEDADRGSKAARASWLQGTPEEPRIAAKPRNPFAPDDDEDVNPFAPRRRQPPENPFAPASDALADNPFAPRRPERPSVAPGSPRKLALLARGLAVFGTYAKVLLEDDVPLAYVQFGPLSAYPRALRHRELYPQLPDSPLPAIITCISTAREARDRGLAIRLVGAVCDDLAARGFAAVESYPEVGARLDGTSAATPAFWERCGFSVAVADERFPVMRRELT
jgi:GNAT superfamily N-acetyltransferase